MSRKPAESGRIAPTRPNSASMESGRERWKHLHAIIDIKVAAISFLVTMAVVVSVLAFANHAIDDAVRRLVLDVTHEDVAEDSGANDALLRAHIASHPDPEVQEIAIVGASYVATFYETDPSARMYRLLEKRLSADTGNNWHAVNLASPGYDVWSYFFMARLLRVRRPPQVLIVSLDALRPKGRNRHLVLNGGDALSQFSAEELADAVPRRQLALFRTEASLQERVRPYTRWLETLTGLRRLARAVEPLSRAVATRITGRDLLNDNELTPDGHHKSWRERPAALARIQKMQRERPRLDRMDDQTVKDLDRLGRELAACRRSGIRVLVVTMPKNPAVPIDFAATHERLDRWAEQYGLEFHDYWNSGIVPDTDFADTGHFFGGGCRIMADELSRLVARETGR
jgi:hypothetical protein